MGDSIHNDISINSPRPPLNLRGGERGSYVVASGSKGFTLVEVILTMILLTLMVGVTSVLMGRGADLYDLVSARTKGLDQARFAMMRMQRDLMSLGSLTNISTPGLIEYMDGAVRTDFHASGNILYRRTTVGATVDNNELAQDVSALQFTYYDDLGNATTTLGAVRRIRVEMTVLAPDATKTLSLRSEVVPRNFIYANFQYP